MPDRPYSNWEGLPEGWTPRDGSDSISDALFGPDGSQRMLAEVGIALTHLLVLKNQRYGDSALSPMSVFATGITPRQRMAVRMDDKINRLANGMGVHGGDREHPGIDLAGYILLDVIAAWQE